MKIANISVKCSRFARNGDDSNVCDVWSIIEKDNLDMAAVSRPFDANGDSKEVALAKKIAELKKRFILAGKWHN